ncbi:MAG: hypothetical protein AVDCRST_MAG25-2130 [uncultured Rubrobacteraceae bacterium]|uniref:Uncharacterized protein n=1 Tax=uncultured Rubrobacteraceae bacterium TaxID=349277 RepID=A0A6J4RIV2_9ACTN|nr:MAG: hypothetical protein AVDCRST_MAG25-2130 [uncultured Rubrobacteraceae bacterium]
MEAPTMLPSEFFMGETVVETSTLRPSLVMRTVSYWSTPSPRLIRSRIPRISSGLSGGTRMLMGRPTASSAE